MLEEKIRESIKRLDEKPWKDWNAATIISIKKWLFPRILDYLGGKREEEKTMIEEAKEIFEVKKEEGGS